jgi:multisubunit Na+/H+ antiporter MnhF subunit
MNEWEIVAAVLSCGLLACVGVCAFAGAESAFVALELAGTVVVTILMVLAVGLRRQPFIDLALTLAVVEIVGALAVARLLEDDL